MNAPTIAAHSSTQLQPNRNQNRSAPLHDAFVSRAAGVNGLIDEKTSLVMESARLRSLAKGSPENNERCQALLCELEKNIKRLQEVINRELKGLSYSLQKAPAPSRFLDDLPR